MCVPVNGGRGHLWFARGVRGELSHSMVPWFTFSPPPHPLRDLQPLPLPCLYPLPHPLLSRSKWTPTRIRPRRHAMNGLQPWKRCLHPYPLHMVVGSLYVTPPPRGQALKVSFEPGM